ncbi:MAG: ShlB/FhaC/HecB family hemolysin secretion/activation protein [Pseudomonadota bacterium]
MSGNSPFCRVRFILIVLLLLAATKPAVAVQPDAGTLLREAKEPPPSARQEKRPPVKPPLSPPEDKTGIKIRITGFDFEGYTLFSREELQEELADLIGQELTMSQLEVAAQRIVSFYRKRGRIASAFLPRQEVKDGRVLIKIIEGKLGSVTIDPKSKSRLRPDRALGTMVRENKSGESINLDALEAAIRLLKGLPGVSASTTLLPGTERGTSDLVIHLADTPLFSGSLDGDNFGSVSSGEYRGGMTLNLNNPFGYGDQLSLRGQTSLKNNYGRLGFSRPVGLAGARLSLSSSYLYYDLGDALQSKGSAVTGGGGFSYPILRRQAFNLSGQLGYEFRRLYNEARGLPLSDKRLHSGSIGLIAEAGDRLLGGGFNSFSIGFGGGTVDLSTVPSDETQDKAGPKRDGLFGKFTYYASRTQTIKENRTSLSLSINGQHALKNLDSSEQFSLGGAYGVRAYSSSEAMGDNGFVATAELRQMVFETLQAGLFYDFGWIRTNTNVWSGWNSGSSKPNEYTLDGVGLGLTWTPATWCLIKGMVATRISSNPGADPTGNDADGTKRVPRFWVQTSINF